MKARKILVQINPNELYYISQIEKDIDTVNKKNKENIEHLCSKAVRGDYEPACESRRAKFDSH